MAIFFINFAAMVPSIMVMAIAVDSILLYIGDRLEEFISMTFSNAALLITSVLLLRSGKIGYSSGFTDWRHSLESSAHAGPVVPSLWLR